MSIGRRIGTLAMGMLAGLVATLLMVLLMVMGRTWLGISPPPEAIPDRFAPTIDIDTFFSLFNRFGGYNGLKKFGIRSGLTGLFAVGILVGLAYAAIVESRHSRTVGVWRLGLSRIGLRFVVITALVLWIASLIVLWPVLDANYRGLPPSTARLVSALGLLVAYAGYGVMLIMIYRFVMRRSEMDALSALAGVSVGDPVGRRVVLAGAAGALLAAPSYGLLRRLYDRATFAYDGTPYSGPGIEPIAPNDKFYTVTKNVVDPNVTTAFWRLEVGGLVEDAKTYSFDDLTSLMSVDQETTLMCISNHIGAGLFSNANWKGIPMRDLLAASRPKEGAVEVMLYGADGYTDTFAFEKAMEPTTLVVYKMNGKPLPQRHGYPVRVIVPGLFGEKNVKWVTGIEVVDHDAKGFYEQQGWGPNFVIPTRSDLFAPAWTREGGKDAFREPMRANQTTILRGRAFAGNRGVTKVEVSLDDGENWQSARIDYPGTQLTWVFWSYDWRPTKSGDYVVTSRATDGSGAVQPSDARGIVPQGATGYHRVAARVDG
ncbi:MAG: molybdopterin-dependent oxidoreductase [Chloroflexota bacterium]|nr:molybdopterin-dependent oxidoreductase [Chloroflexota bacterium]